MEISEYYDLNYTITYPYIEDKIESNVQYRIDLMSIFKINVSKDSEITDDIFQQITYKQDKMYEILKKNKKFEDLIENLIKKEKYKMFINGKKKSAFSFLFNYDVLNYMDSLIKYINNNNTNKIDKYYNELKNFIEKE
jgi:hypothetical protein